jgi:hypothetical protein
MRLSVLDQSPVRKDGSAADAVAASGGQPQSITYDFQSRLRSYELLAKEFGLTS